jgi:formylglycine-generating enzyme required for sulfatase activity
MKIFFRLLFLSLSLPLLVFSQQKITWEKDGKDMMLVPAGSFEMGDHFNEGQAHELPVHTVTLDAFYMDTHEVTVGQFEQFVNQSGYSYDKWNDVAKYSPGDEYPMIDVSWNDTVAYAEWAGKRLPTEAEWEYAARGGLFGRRYPWGDEITQDDANYSGIGGKDQWKYNAPVGSFEANGYGLYDMAGNVYEWCQDWYGGNYYTNLSAKNPLGPGTGSSRVLRGGSSADNIYELRLALRNHDNPHARGGNDGFRCVSGLN